MANEHYHRGGGECVLPKIRKPNCKDPVSDDELFKANDEWRNHILSQPVVRSCHEKEPIGWLKGYREEYQMKIVGTGRWDTISKH